ncbi:MAG TPA: aminotransferase class III-fold pyridoxal phosphate-dependent enzyme [Flavobacteriia bacterium]|nr:aminotransferase class III-fold pyridoxal phosphate-dependent enzyme [Flavobacteriia bacterium]
MLQIINLLSDTVTKPTKKMLQAMFDAEVGDDVFREDPTVNALQEKVAKLFGMEDALFFPSGTMANQVAINIHANQAGQMICDKWAHVYNFEGGGAAATSGVTSYLIDGNRGMFTVEQVKEGLHLNDNIHLPQTALVAIENTTNKGGGACWDIAEIKKISNLCKQKGINFHLDGARLFNAIVAKNEAPKTYGTLFDTISICLSKGLGAPIGSVLIGSKKHITKALRVRKRLGGGMRQVGYLAAAGIYALDNHVNRLKEDHQKAKKLEATLQNCTYVKSVEPVETNIVIFNVNNSVKPEDFILTMKQKGILLTEMGQGKIRMVTHLDITDEMIEKVINELKSFDFGA